MYSSQLKVAFRHRLYFDHLIHSLHIHSAAYVVLIFVLPMEDLANRLWWALVLQFSLTFYLLAYLVISLQHVHGASWRGTAAKAFCILFVYMTLIAAASEALRHLTMSGSDAGRFSLSEDQSQNNQPALPIAWR